MPSSPSRRAGSGLTIDGVTAGEIVVPASPRDVAEILADAESRNLAVAPFGGGSALALGNPPQRIDLALSTENLAGILDYEPTDLVLSVGAGARLADVQAVLAEHGQRLPIDPPGAEEATIGGVIATARSGPLRYSAGTLRDLLIGISIAHPSGTVTRAGGMVVKNVSGYDMPRLYHGALGTLGVVVSANLKVLPRPQSEATVIAASTEPTSAFAAAARIRDANIPIAALEVYRQDDTWHVAARIEGREPTVAAIALRAEAVAGGEAKRLEGAESSAWWRDYVASQKLRRDDDLVLVRCAVRPRETAVLAEGIAAVAVNLGIAAPLLAASPGLGTVIAGFDLGAAGSADKLAELRSMLIGLAGTTTILRAPAPWKAGVDVWGPLPDGFEVMQALRAEFDPGRTINRGRFAGFL